MHCITMAMQPAVPFLGSWGYRSRINLGWLLSHNYQTSAKLSQTASGMVKQIIHFHCTTSEKTLTDNKWIMWIFTLTCSSLVSSKTWSCGSWVSTYLQCIECTIKQNAKAIHWQVNISVHTSWTREDDGFFPHFSGSASWHEARPPASCSKGHWEADY